MRKLVIALGMILVLLLVSFTGCSETEEADDMDAGDDTMMNEDMVQDETSDDMAMDDEMDTDMEMEASTYIDLSPMEAKELIDNDPDVIIIDVSPAYDNGHLPGAVNYYVSDGSLDEAIPMLDKNATYLVYCHVDSAAIAGAEKLVEAGFMNVYRLEGNYSAWVNAGYPIEK